MSFLQRKSWIAQEFYNEYLATKQDILELTKRLDISGDVADEAELIDKIKYMRMVLKELKLHGVDLEDLILLSMNVDVEHYR